MAFLASCEVQDSTLSNISLRRRLTTFGINPEANLPVHCILQNQKQLR